MPMTDAFVMLDEASPFLMSSFFGPHGSPGYLTGNSLIDRQKQHQVRSIHGLKEGPGEVKVLAWSPGKSCEHCTDDSNEQTF